MGYYPRAASQNQVGKPLYHHSTAAQPERSEAERVHWPLYHYFSQRNPSRAKRSESVDRSTTNLPQRNPSGAKPNESVGCTTPAQPERSEAHSLDNALSHSNDCLPFASTCPFIKRSSRSLLTQVGAVPLGGLWEHFGMSLNVPLEARFYPPKKSCAPTLDLQPQTISPALVAAFGTAEFQRRSL